MTSSSAFVSRRPEETKAVGERLGLLLQAGDTVLLSGELGAGKTTFVQGFARGLGCDASVSSKSFVIQGEYRGGRAPLYHADLYRLEEPQQVWELGLDEIARDGVLVVEWPERALDVLPEEHLLVRFEVVDEDTRSIEFSGKGARAKEVLRALELGARA